MADVLVAGGSGFIGAHLVRTLREQGHSVTIVSIRSSRPSADVISVDLRNRDEVMAALKGRRFERVFNLSGYIDHTPFAKGGRAVLDQHFQAVMNLIEGLDRSALKSFVQVGSSDEYGSAPAPIAETAREAPIAPYSVGKVAATHLVQALSKTEGFPGVVVRLFLTYGPGQDKRRFIPQIVSGCLSGDSFKASEGKQLRDFCYVADTVDALIKASTATTAQGEIINVGSGRPVTVRSVVETIVKMVGAGRPEYGAIPYRAGESMALYPDVSKAKRLLGWQAQTSLEDGLRRTIEEFRRSPSVLA